jgi:16S rRNA G527 N7-methylase RsmG
VTRKKSDFLRLAIEELGLEGVEISDLDWRTFNRKAYYEIDFFVTKAAFSDSEIVRMFRHGCNYREKPLVYWASSLWICEQKSQPFVRECFDYVNGKRECRLVVFSLPETSFLKKVNN